jgi:mannose-6-phosphate isomerase-like protein (cupin superfamily)
LTDVNDANGSIISFDDLPHTAHSHEFVGADHGDVPFSVILVNSKPGVGPAVHRHPYPEVFIVDEGEATFRLGDDELVVTAGHVVVGPANVPHGFTNTGDGGLRLTAIHGAPEFVTEWLGEADRDWVSPPRP